jgi:hypothetical protein
MEAQFALSGAEVETWESSSSRGDVVRMVKRKHAGVDANDDSNKRRKLDTGDSHSLSEDTVEVDDMEGNITIVR